MFMKKKSLHQSIESWNLVFCLPVVGKVGSEIMFRLRVLNTVWILLSAVEAKGLPCCNGAVRRVATKVFYWGFILLSGWASTAPFCVTESENLMTVSAKGLFCMCLGFHCPICDSIRCDNGVSLQVVSYILFLSFLPGPTELVRVTALLIMQRQKYGQSFLMSYCLQKLQSNRLLLHYFLLQFVGVM
jgi:hypothetical protein